jgi:hypothetical protein
VAGRNGIDLRDGDDAFLDRRLHGGSSPEGYIKPEGPSVADRLRPARPDAPTLGVVEES